VTFFAETLTVATSKAKVFLMKTNATAAAIETARAQLAVDVTVSEDGGLVLVTAPDRAALVAAYTTVRLAIESTGRSVRGVKIDGKSVWTPPRSESVRGGMRFALTADESERNLRGF
jgi:hypothetical protein